LQLVAWVLLQHENEVQDKRVESVWFPCLDEGSTPSSSTSLRPREVDSLATSYIGWPTSRLLSLMIDCALVF